MVLVYRSLDMLVLGSNCSYMTVGSQFCKGTVGNQIFGQHVPGTSLGAGGSGSTADRLVEAGSVSRPADRRLVGTVMSLPPFALHQEARDDFRGIAEIEPVPIEGSLAAPVDIGVGVVRLALNGGKADPGHVRSRRGERGCRSSSGRWLPSHSHESCCCS
jgi:hypothetical protein